MARPAHLIDQRLLSKVGKLYYELGLTQHDIAERLHLSRPKVSRLLQQAVDTGIVQITVISPPGIYSNMEQQLEEKFGLHEAVIVEVEASASANTIAKELGVAAASYFQRTIQDGDVVGLSWGMTLNAMSTALQPCDARGIHVVQLIGGLGAPDADMHANELCRRTARMTNARLTLIPAPGIVDSLAVKEALLSDSYVQAAFDAFKALTVAYIGIGTPSVDSMLYQSRMISSQEIIELTEHGAIGDVALRFIDAKGQPVHSSLSERVLGISIDELKRVDRVIGVAGGQGKRDVVYASLAGKLINVLITDQSLAAELLKMKSSEVAISEMSRQFG
jgi:DNA-binding transcriptional regulator LsrR (DeoR family)